jgi:hypothetical protein
MRKHKRKHYARFHIYQYKDIHDPDIKFHVLYVRMYDFYDYK